ncbi:hypothetical protein GCM10010363_61710 [Streptomyces omiyaensis]|nr:hypothetical protein GCM10010363_61710 [Streptomyces omiyaensis]
MTDRDMTLEGTERGLVEDLGHEAHVLEDEDLGAVADRDSRGFLTPMLEGVEPEVRELCDLFTRSPDTEDATRVLGAFLAGEQVVIESTVTTWHVFESRGPRPQVRMEERSVDGPRAIAPKDRRALGGAYKAGGGRVLPPHTPSDHPLVPARRTLRDVTQNARTGGFTGVSITRTTRVDPGVGR